MAVVLDMRSRMYFPFLETQGTCQRFPADSGAQALPPVRKSPAVPADISGDWADAA